MKGLHKIRQKWNDSKLGRNDISVRIYLSFVVVLAVSLLLTGAIFNYLYQRNYTRSYTELLTKQGKDSTPGVQVSVQEEYRTV